MEPTSVGKVIDLDPALQRTLERCQALYISEDELERWEAKQGERARRDRLDASGISERLDAEGALAVINDTPRPTRALTLVRPWMLSSRPMLALFGDVGQGKTVAAAWALARVAGRYVTAQALCELRAAGWRERGRFESHLRTELLVVDELGRERDAAQALETLMEVVDMRQRLPRRTLLLGNIDAATLIARYDKATLDRLGLDSDDSGIAVVRYLRGESLRKATSR